MNRWKLIMFLYCVGLPVMVALLIIIDIEGLWYNLLLIIPTNDYCSYDYFYVILQTII